MREKEMAAAERLAAQSVHLATVLRALRTNLATERATCRLLEPLVEEDLTQLAALIEGQEKRLVALAQRYRVILSRLEAGAATQEAADASA